MTAGLAVGCDNNVSRILYLVSPDPVPATVDASSVPLLLYVCDKLFPDAPPAAVSFAIVSVTPSPQSTENVQEATVFVVLFCKKTVLPLSAVVIALPPFLVALFLIAKATAGAAVATVI